MDSVRFGAKFSLDSQTDMLKNYKYFINTFMKHKPQPYFSLFSGSEISTRITFAGVVGMRLMGFW